MAGGKLTQDIRYCNADAANARPPTHLPWIDGNAFQQLVHTLELSNNSGFAHK
jgi:hypothetical protein